MQFRHFLVTGRVQGVSFRAFTKKRATALGLRGWVRNLSDGRVEILAAGDESAMAEFEKAIARGPMLAQVEKIEKHAVETDLAYTDFRTRDTEEAPWPQTH